MLSGLQLGWVEPPEIEHAGLLIIAFVVPLQFLTAIFGFLARDVVAGTGMAILSGTWLSIGLVTLTAAPGSTSDALGMLLTLSAAAMLLPASAATGAGAILTTTALRFLMTALYQLTGSGAWKITAGVVGLALRWPSTARSRWHSRKVTGARCCRFYGATPAPSRSRQGTRQPGPGHRPRGRRRPSFA